MYRHIAAVSLPRSSGPQLVYLDGGLYDSDSERLYCLRGSEVLAARLDSEILEVMTFSESELIVQTENMLWIIGREGARRAYYCSSDEGRVMVCDGRLGFESNEGNDYSPAVFEAAETMPMPMSAPMPVPLLLPTIPTPVIMPQLGLPVITMKPLPATPVPMPVMPLQLPTILPPVRQPTDPAPTVVHVGPLGIIPSPDSEGSDREDPASEEEEEGEERPLLPTLQPEVDSTEPLQLEQLMKSSLPELVKLPLELDSSYPPRLAIEKPPMYPKPQYQPLGPPIAVPRPSEDWIPTPLPFMEIPGRIPARGGPRKPRLSQEVDPAYSPISCDNPGRLELGAGPIPTARAGYGPIAYAVVHTRKGVLSHLVSVPGYVPVYLVTDAREHVKRQHRLYSIYADIGKVRVADLRSDRSLTIDLGLVRDGLHGDPTITVQYDGTIIVQRPSKVGVVYFDVFRPIWSPEQHWLFPTITRLAIRTLLLMCQRLPILGLVPRGPLHEIAGWIAA